MNIIQAAAVVMLLRVLLQLLQLLLSMIYDCVQRCGYNSYPSPPPPPCPRPFTRQRATLAHRSHLRRGWPLQPLIAAPFDYWSIDSLTLIVTVLGPLLIRRLGQRFS